MSSEKSHLLKKERRIDASDPPPPVLMKNAEAESVGNVINRKLEAFSVVGGEDKRRGSGVAVVLPTSK